MNPTSAIASRISRRFQELRASGEMGVVAFITAGDPSLEATEKFVLALAESGADVIELGVPFSDPLADGPTIQRASERALKSGTTLQGVLELVRRIRRSSQVPLVLFSYYNPVFQMGLEKFAASACSAGADGVLITDLTPEESSDYRRILSGDFDEVADEWVSHCNTIGRQVSIQQGAETIHGRAEALDSDGALLLRTSHGRLERIMGGDVSVNKV